MASIPNTDQQFVVDELCAASNSLGKIDLNDNTYMISRDCKASLKDIIRFLSKDDDQHTTRLTLGRLNIIKTDLIPLMVQYCDYYEGDSDLFTTILRLCTNLTSSILLLFQENKDKPMELEDQALKNQLLNCLYRYKEAFAEDDQVWPVLNTHFKKNTKDEIAFERLIILIRNILHIPVDSRADMGVHPEFDTHDMCLYRMHKSGMLNTLIQFADNSEKGTEYCFHIMEIIYLMLRDQNPETIAKADKEYFKKTLGQEDVDKKRLAELSARERHQKQLDRRLIPGRFSGASFVVANCKSISNEPLVVRKPLKKREDLELGKGKQELRKAKNKKPLNSETSMNISDKNTKFSKVTYGLKVFCYKFVEKVFNNFMLHIKHNLIQKKAQDNDETYYLWAVQFFSAFSRHFCLPVDHISEILSTSSLHFIQMLVSGYQDKLKVEKKNFQDTSKRLHLAVRAYRETMLLIQWVKSQAECPFAKTVETIQSNIFTQTEYSSLLLSLFNTYEEPKHSIHYLEDLIMANSTFLELYGSYAGNQENVGFFVNRYCNPDVIKAHMIVLKRFKTNESQVNAAVVRFLERMVYDCKAEGCLFQASVFKCLLEIMDYPGQLEGLRKLTVHLIENFAVAANKRRWMFQEILFWKTFNEVISIEQAIDPPPARPLEEESDLPGGVATDTANDDVVVPETSSQLERSLDDDIDRIDDEELGIAAGPESKKDDEDELAALRAELNDISDLSSDSSKDSDAPSGVGHGCEASRPSSPD